MQYSNQEKTGKMDANHHKKKDENKTPMPQMGLELTVPMVDWYKISVVTSYELLQKQVLNNM